MPAAHSRLFFLLLSPPKPIFETPQDPLDGFWAAALSRLSALLPPWGKGAPSASSLPAFLPRLLSLRSGLPGPPSGPGLFKECLHLRAFALQLPLAGTSWPELAPPCNPGSGQMSAPYAETPSLSLWIPSLCSLPAIVCFLLKWGQGFSFLVHYSVPGA